MPIQQSHNKWMFMIALAHIDNRLMKVEKDFLKDKIMNYAHPGMVDSLLERVDKSGFNAPKPDFAKFAIKAPEDKVDVLFLAHELFWVDGHLDEREAFALDFILAEIKKDKDALLLLKERVEKLDRKKPDEMCLKKHIEDFFYG